MYGTLTTGYSHGSTIINGPPPSFSSSNTIPRAVVDGHDIRADHRAPSPITHEAYRQRKDMLRRRTTSSSLKHLLPLFNPKYNLREMCKEAVLLEDHLSHSEKRCDDCITKHFLKLEGLAEEAITLDDKGVLPHWFDSIPGFIRKQHNTFASSPGKWKDVAQGVRQMRKYFQPHCQDVFENSPSSAPCTECTKKTS
jgi:hypothetical protein